MAVNKHFNKRVRIHFVAIIVTILMLLVADAVQTYFETSPIYNTSWQRMLSACFGYTIRPAILFAFALLYCRDIKFKHKVLISIPLLTNLIVVFCAFVSSKVFYYSPTGEVVRGPLLAFPFITCLIYFGIILFIGIKNIKFRNYQEITVLSLIFIFSIAATLLEMYLRTHGTICIVCAVGTVFYYIYFITNHFSIDPLTGACVRGKLYEVVEKYGGSFSVICFDVNGLKIINDTKGHLAGDKALVEIVKSIRTVLPSNSEIYRMGGDEFVIYYKSTQENQIIDLTKDVKTAVDNTGYSIAVGYSIKNDVLLFEKALDRADKMMYQDKKEIKMKIGINDSFIEN